MGLPYKTPFDFPLDVPRTGDLREPGISSFSPWKLKKRFKKP